MPNLFGNPTDEECRLQRETELQQAEIRHLKENIKDLNNQISTLKTEKTNSVQEKSNENSRHSAEVTRLKREVDDRKADIMGLKQTVADLTSQLESGKDSNKTAIVNQERTNTQLAHVNQERERLKNRETALEQQVASLQEKVRVCEATITQQNAELTTERKNTSTWKDKHGEMQVRIMELTKEKESLMQRSEDEGRSAAALSKESSVQKEKQEHHVQELSRLKEENAALKRNEKYLETKVKEREEQIAVEKAKREARDKEIARSKETLDKTTSDERKAGLADKEKTLELFNSQNAKALDTVQQTTAMVFDRMIQMQSQMQKQNQTTLNSLFTRPAYSGPSAIESTQKIKQITDADDSTADSIKAASE